LLQESKHLENEPQSIDPRYNASNNAFTIPSLDAPNKHEVTNDAATVLHMAYVS